MKLTNKLYLILSILCLGFSNVCVAEQNFKAALQEYDLVIYGGNSAGIIAAVQAKKDGLSVIVVSPDKHLGGLTAGGLGWTDSGNKSVIGGLSRNFYQRLKSKYDQPSTWKFQPPEEFKLYRKNEDAMWVFEPHIAEEVYEELVREFQIAVVRPTRLDLKDGVIKQKNRILSIKMEDGTTYSGKIFMDVTYEGDLMAKAGVSYTTGREANSVYNETLNGVQTRNARHHQLDLPVDPYIVPGDRTSGLLPRVHGDSPGIEGEGDHRIQAYCFRMCLSNDPRNRIPFVKPVNYDPLQYELFARYLVQGGEFKFGKFDGIPNHKTDTNNHGGFSFDNIGMNYDYPDGDYATREKIIEEHRDYQLGLLWFLSHDPRVPEKTRTRMQTWGLAKDEFTDNGNWPHQIYVREARRMISNTVINENHLTQKTPTPDSIGMGSYNMDSHNVQRYVDPHGHAKNEGDVQINPGAPYPISYQGIVPKEQECSNLLVPVCVSSSHIAYGSIRMEPVFMILAESATTAASIAIRQNIPVQQVNYEELKARLLKQGQILEYQGNRKDSNVQGGVSPKDLSGMTLDNELSKITGEWRSSHSTIGYIGKDYLHDDNDNKGRLSAEYSHNIKEAGKYLLYLCYTPNPNRATNVPVTITTKSGTTIIKVNQKVESEMKPCAATLGVYQFQADEKITITITNTGTDGYVIVDALRIIQVLE